MDDALSKPFDPLIRPAGLGGVLVTFGDGLSEPANRAALAFSAAVDRAGIAGIEECAPSLVSVFVRFDPLGVSLDAVTRALTDLLQEQDWHAAPLPQGRRFIRVPTVYGGDLAPQFDESAAAAGRSRDDALKDLSEARVRVQTIGFAPGQPYLGLLPEAWNIPRQTNLTQAVPEGALVLAIRQLVLFSVTNPTGWRHVGQTALKLFRPDSDDPFFLRPGDEVQFVPVDRDVLENARSDPDGGAEIQVIR
ncbi:allophanate hydrolase subunit 1 [Marivita sp. S6314]|uniref:5-oxoprolinase subunit B family protein n=1 Tax=Marivita sp. S6314 TaxID=2926406 RepID=UPI001FF29A94|nr:allophanate hydrolase subunit 1 [Marivita sp. S6314]MCK0149056.1 allophanate hydrolase subunit 1 [Marivita sp. S6314]